jgi:uncharacterized protein (DUF1697 family)
MPFGKPVIMTTYIAFLRGINVGGNKPMKMPHLVSALESLKFTNVRTYLQSGNVVFDALQGDSAAITFAVEKKLHGAFGWEIPVVVRTARELAKILGSNPFLSTVQPEYLYVTLLAQSPGKKEAAGLALPAEKGEEFKILGKEIFLILPHGYGRTKLSNNSFEKKLGCAATTRSWKTLSALAEMAGK